MTPQDFVAKASFIEVASCLLYDKLIATEDSSLIKILFEGMICESINNYAAIFDILPLESLNPAILAPYLPPGRSE